MKNNLGLFFQRAANVLCGRDVPPLSNITHVYSGIWRQPYTQHGTGDTRYNTIELIAQEELDGWSIIERNSSSQREARSKDVKILKRALSAENATRSLFKLTAQKRLTRMFDYDYSTREFDSTRPHVTTVMARLAAGESFSDKTPPSLPTACKTRLLKPLFALRLLAG